MMILFLYRLRWTVWIIAMRREPSIKDNRKVEKLNLNVSDYLERFDSYNFFQKSAI